MACGRRRCSVRRLCNKCRVNKCIIWGEARDARTKLELDGKFWGRSVKIRHGGKGAIERFEFFYGGLQKPNGLGHGHVVSRDGVHIHYWRKPQDEGACVIIDDNNSTERLAGYIF